MKSSLTLLTAVILFITCAPKDKQKPVKSNEVFTIELQQLKEYFHIPGLAVLVQKGDSVLYEDYMGYANMENKIKVEATTEFPIASITKMFAGVALMKLMEEGNLSLEDPIDNYLTHATFGDSIKVKHILSHTSQGQVGQHFYYSYRFGALTPVIAKASNTSFEAYIENEVFRPLGLTSTYMFSDSSSVNPSTAQPYNFDANIVPGIMEFGASASAGIVSTARNMAAFSKALENNSLITPASKHLMYVPFIPSSPYGLGIFTQEIANKNIVWAYGQYDSYSSLLLKVPEDELTLVLLANNNLLSDPARLINGDVSSSLFAMSFLKNYVLEQEEVPLFESAETLSKNTSEFHRKKIMAEALAASFMARFDDKALEKSKQLLRTFFTLYPDYLEHANLNLLHTLTFIKNVHFHKDLGSFEAFDPQIEAISKKLLEEDMDNPYVNVYMGAYFDQKGDLEKAKVHYENIIHSKNFSPFWYTAEAKNWLAQNN
ncbi:MAG: serine hydrolase domain-containing protein [Bacteroidota bacterium]